MGTAVAAVKTDSVSAKSQPPAIQPSTTTAKQPDTSKPSIAVMDFGGLNVAKPEAEALADRFRYELMQTQKFDVMERAQMKLILQEQAFQQTDCVDQSCAVQAGQLIAVKKMVTGTVAKVGGIYTVNVKVLDVATGKIDRNMSQDCDCPVEKVLTETLHQLAYKMAGLEVKEEKTQIAIERGDASLFIKTNPDGARIFIDGRMVDGSTPVTLENLTAGKHLLRLTKADFIATVPVVLEANKVKRVDLTLEKQKTTVKILSVPSDAEVYIDKKPGKGTKPDQLTPAIFENITKDTVMCTIFKVGYKDTTVRMPLLVNQENAISISLNEASVDLIKTQKKMVSARKKRTIGAYFSVSSLAIAAVGGAVYYLSTKDYQTALDDENRLNSSSLHQGSEFDALKKENEDKSNAWKSEDVIAKTLWGVGGAGLVLGLVLYF